VLDLLVQVLPFFSSTWLSALFTFISSSQYLAPFIINFQFSASQQHFAAMNTQQQQSAGYGRGGGGRTSGRGGGGPSTSCGLYWFFHSCSETTTGSFETTTGAIQQCYPE